MKKTEPANSDFETGQALKSRRVKRGKTLKHMAYKLQISLAYLSQLESGKRRWRHSMVEAYEQLLAK
jgi:transcriptional regulator with XRE-family HTH domain